MPGSGGISKELLPAGWLPIPQGGMILPVPRDRSSVTWWQYARLPTGVHAWTALATAALAMVLASPGISAQAKPAAAQQPAAKTPKSPPTGPAAPQSRHYPILLIASGINPTWSARIGMKGAEQLEREGYPPITLEPGEVSQDAAPMTWTYHAKDTATGADVAVHLVREPCMVGMDTKYSFSVALDHAQIGTLKGCARIAPDQFPEFKQKNLDDDDPEKKKIGPPPITNFKAPVAVAYLDATGHVVLKRGAAARIVAPKGSQLSLSHDGKRLLFTREDTVGEHTVVLFDASTGKTTELLRGLVQEEQAFWSPDDSHIAFLKSDGGVSHIWVAPAASPDQATQVSATPVNHLDGWADARTVVAANSDSFLWIAEDGGTTQVLSAHDLCGPDFEASTSDSVRVSPINPDLLLVSAPILKPASGAATAAKTGYGGGLFFYELRSKRRTLLTPPEAFATQGEWSRDSLQIFFTNREKRGDVVDRIFWDGSEIKRYLVGSNFVVGE